MKIQAKNIQSFMARPPDHICAVLVYGNDAGLVRERAQTITNSVVDDLQDPFRVVNIECQSIVQEPARLRDEALSIALGGGKKVVRIQAGSENISKGLELLFDEPNLEALTIIEANQLRPQSPLRKLMEKKETAAVIACYEDNYKSRISLIDQMAETHGLTFSNAAKDYLGSHLGSDRMVSRQELNKLALYMGAERSVKLEDVSAIIGDTGLLSIDEITYSAASGEKHKLAIGLERANALGTPPITMLRATQNHLKRLLDSQLRIRKGDSPLGALKKLRPPIIYTFEELFRIQLKIWPTPLLIKSLAQLNKADEQCKSTGMPERAIVERALLRVASIAKSLPNQHIERTF